MLASTFIYDKMINMNERAYKLLTMTTRFGEITRHGNADPRYQLTYS